MTRAAVSSPPAGVRTVREAQLRAPFPFFVHPEWAEALPWVLQGITGRGDDGAPFDMGLFTARPSREVQDRWRALRRHVGFAGAVHARQVHGARALIHAAAHDGLLIADDADGHVTTVTGLLLTVSIADCVPISLLDDRRRAAALLHAGWRGTAASILEEGIASLRAAGSGPPFELRMHLGPAICGACYEVGPEVHRALGIEDPGAPATVDLRALLARRAVQAGLAADRITVSDHCTRCGDGSFSSHRGGHAERQVAVLGFRQDTRRP